MGATDIDHEPPDGAEACVAEARRHLERSGPFPHPGGGATLERWWALAEVARRDLGVARIVEGHVDAAAVLAELGEPVPPGLLAVWAARPEEVSAVATPTGWRLSGSKPWCSGAGLVDLALVTALAADGARLFVVAAPTLPAVPGTWRPLGMTATRSRTVRFDDVELAPDAAIGEPGAYVGRPGFAHGGCGVAACWWGGACGVLDDLAAATRERPDDLALAAYGDAELSVHEAGLVLEAAAAAIDADPHDGEVAALAAARTRGSCARAGAAVLATAARFLGTSRLGGDPTAAGRVADLTTYLTQHRPTAAVDLGRRLLEHRTGR